MINWLIECLIDLLINWFIDWCELVQVCCIAIVATSADPYTIAQVNAGIPALRAALSGQPGVITGISYGNGIVQGHLGNAGLYNVAPYAYNTAPVAYTASYAAPLAYSGAHYIGKREADSNANAYTIGQVAAGLPYANAVATGHAHNPGYIAYTSFPQSSVYSGYHVSPLGYPSSAYSTGVYAASPYVHSLGKRAADANAYTGNAHNPGYIAYTSYPSTTAYTAYNAVPVANYAYGTYAAPYYG